MGHVLKINPATGKPIWQTNTPGEYTWVGDQITGAGNNIAIIVGHLFILDSETGSILESQKTITGNYRGGSHFMDGPVSASDWLFVDGSHYFYAYKKEARSSTIFTPGHIGN